MANKLSDSNILEFIGQPISAANSVNDITVCHIIIYNIPNFLYRIILYKAYTKPCI